MSDSYFQNIDLSLNKQIYLRVAECAPNENSLRTELVQAARNLGREAGEKKIALVLENDYESVVCCLAFMESGVPFTPYRLLFRGKPEETEPEMIRVFLERHGLTAASVEFDFGNAEHVTGLERLRSSTGAVALDSLFKTWMACQMDEVTVFPGSFVTPVHESQNHFHRWDILDVYDLSLYDFMKKFGGVPSFLTSNGALIRKQTECLPNQALLQLFRAAGKSLATSSPVFRKLLALEWGYPEIAEFDERFQSEPDFKKALKKFDRRTNEDFAELIHRARLQADFPHVNQELGFSVMPFDGVEQSDIYQTLLRSGTRNDLRGSFVEAQSEKEGTELLAVFPTLFTSHQYTENLSAVRHFVEGREYHQNLANTYTRTDLHLASELSDLVGFFNKAVLFYFEQMRYIFEDFEIVQCWATKTQRSEAHHLHTHPNCLLSGIFYLSDGGSQTVFTLKRPRDFVLTVSSRTPWNVGIFHSTPVEGRLLLFPSNIEHYTTAQPDAEKDRYCIAFNVIPRGEISDLNKGSWLKL